MPSPNQQLAHTLAVNSAENVRQISKATTNTAAGHKAADIAYYTAVLASGRANGYRTNALEALRTLGVIVSGQDGD